jgi:hypothetical protein
MSWHLVNSEVVEAEQPALQAEDDLQRFKLRREIIAELASVGRDKDEEPSSEGNRLIVVRG